MRQITLDRLYELRLHGMREAPREQLQKGGADELTFEERPGLLIEAEDAWRQSNGILVRRRRPIRDGNDIFMEKS